MFVKPMMMAAGQPPIDGPDYIYEPMLDGQRLILSFINNKARLFTKHNNEVTDRYPELLRIPLIKPMDAVFDGEAVFQYPQTGEFDFEMLMKRFRMTKPAQIRDGMKEFPVQYYIFDLLYADGNDLRSMPLAQRKKYLNEIVEDNMHIHVMPYSIGDGVEMMALAERYKLEGVACKYKYSDYVEGRSRSWMKMSGTYEPDVHITA